MHIYFPSLSHTKCESGSDFICYSIEILKNAIHSSHLHRSLLPPPHLFFSRLCPCSNLCDTWLSRPHLFYSPVLTFLPVLQTTNSAERTLDPT